MSWYTLPPLLLQTLIWIPTRIILVVFYRFRVSGLEHIAPINKGVIFAANHTSEIDPVLLPAALPFLSRFMPMFYTSLPKRFYQDKKFGLKRYFYGGQLFKTWGAYAVVPSVRNYELSLAHHLRLITDNQSVMIFPEGKIRRGTELKAKGGVAYLACATGAPVVPVHIAGVAEKKYTITFGKPLYTQDLCLGSTLSTTPRTPDEYQIVAQYIMKKIDELA